MLQVNFIIILVSSIKDFYFLEKNVFLSQHIMTKSSRLGGDKNIEDNIIKGGCTKSF